MNRLAVCSADVAADVAREVGAAGIVSIGSPGDPIPAGLHLGLNLLRLEFEDLAVTPAMELALRQRHGIELACFTDEHAIKIREFAIRIAGRIVVHCEVGVSRSPAVAAVIAAFDGAGPSEAIQHALGAHRSTYRHTGVRAFDPNIRVLAIGGLNAYGDHRLLHAWAARIAESSAAPTIDLRRWIEAAQDSAGATPTPTSKMV